MTGARAALSALLLTVPSPVLVHDSHERFRATSVPGSGGGPVVYGREAGGWRQYWIYFAANPQDRGILRSGRHAGDWEMVQYRVDGREAVYAQHSGAERCASFEMRDGHPVVYLAEGSHAAYFHAGARDRMWPDPNELRGRARRGPASARRARHGPLPRMDALSGALGRRSGRLVPARAVLAARPGLPGVRWDDPEAWAAAARPCTDRRCVTIGTCDGPEKALTAGLVAAPLALIAAVGWLRRRVRHHNIQGGGDGR